MIASSIRRTRKKNYHKLVTCLRKIKGIGIESGSLSKHFSIRNQYHIERKIRFKNRLDKYFAFSYFPGLQEVFRLTEERDDRIVIALDFNSMYADCMKGTFSDPKALRYVSEEELPKPLDELEEGIYRVQLKGCTSGYFQKFHPFKYVIGSKSLNFQIGAGDCVEALLHKNELVRYERYFKEVVVKEGICSKTTISHPLHSRATRSYKKRMKARSGGNDLLERYYKLDLAMGHSASNPLRYKSHRFDSANEAIEFAKSEYMIACCSKESDLSHFEELLKHKYFNLSQSKGKFTFKGIDLANPERVNSLSSKIMANARIKMHDAMERFYSQEGVDICYCNIDSIHISIPKSEIGSFWDRNKDIISNDIGALKVQALGTKGYWLDVGRYWIYDKDDLSLYKNALFNHAGCSNPFVRRRKHFIRVRSARFDYLIRRYSNIERAFSFNKKLTRGRGGSMGYKRYEFDEISSLSRAYQTLTDEEVASKLIKIDLFDGLEREYHEGVNKTV